jgi:hypothetical protein
MAYSFSLGDIVRRHGRSEDLVVCRTTVGGIRYILSLEQGPVSTLEAAMEDELELVRRASEEETDDTATYVIETEGTP